MTRIRVAIEKWILDNIKRDDLLKFDDLHIDRIDGRFKNRDSWIENGVLCLQVAATARDSLATGFTIALAFALRSGDKKGDDPKFSTLKELEQELDDYTPPSLYLFPRGVEPWKEHPAMCAELSITFCNLIKFRGEGYVIKFETDSESEVSRSIFLAE